MNEAKYFMTCTHSFPPHMLKTFIFPPHYWQLWRIKLLETSYWMQKVKTLNQRPSSKMVYSGNIPWMGGRRLSKQVVPCMRALWWWWVRSHHHFVIFFSKFYCLFNKLSCPHRRSFHRRKTLRSAWHISISYMKTCCRLLPTTMSSWQNLTPMSGHWKAGLNAPSLAEEVSVFLNR